MDKDGKHVRPVAVPAGLSDGTVTEVSGPEVKEGMEVVVGEARPRRAPAAGERDDPFRPRPRPRRAAHESVQSSVGQAGRRSAEGRENGHHCTPHAPRRNSHHAERD